MKSGFFGIEIGGTKLQVVASGEDLVIQERKRYLVDRARGGEGIRGNIQQAIQELKKHWAPLAVGIGFGGPVNWRTGQICCSHHIEGWSEFPLGERVAALASAPVRVDNDANTAALGEAVRGAGLGFNPAFYITLGSGVGGGLALDGKIYHGATPGEAEIGHVRLAKDGTIVEDRCSGWAIDKRIRELKARGEKGRLMDLVGDDSKGEARHLAAALRTPDPVARKLLLELAEDLGFGLSHVVHLFHPEVIVIGGGLSLIGEDLRVEVTSSLRRFTMEAFAPGPEVRLAALGEDAVPTGALVLASMG